MPGRWPSLAHLDRAPELWKCGRRVRDWWPTTRAYLRLGETKYPFDFRTHSGLEIELRDFYEVTTAAWSSAGTSRPFRPTPRQSSISAPTTAPSHFWLRRRRRTPGS